MILLMSPNGGYLHRKQACAGSSPVVSSVAVPERFQGSDCESDDVGSIPTGHPHRLVSSIRP